MEEQTEFERRYGGRLWGVMSWRQLADFWARLDPSAGWHLYAIGEPLPEAPAPADAVREFVARVDALLRAEHREDYCGIVYADDLEAPRLIKIFDPNNLGVSCGSSKNPPLPGWIMSLDAPVELRRSGPLPANRSRWWRSLLAGG